MAIDSNMAMGSNVITDSNMASWIEYGSRLASLIHEAPHDLTDLVPGGPLGGASAPPCLRQQAAVVGGAIIGTTRDQVERARDQLKAMLKQDGPAPDAPFDGLEVLRPAREYKNRHASILLALDATAEAMEQAEQANCA